MNITAKYFLLFFISLLFHAYNTTYACSLVKYQNADTGIEKANMNEAVIDAVIKNNHSPEKEKIEIIGEFTKYGFKNLFTAFSYNSALPYSSQINPHAELYMSDYLQSHGKGLLKLKNYSIPYFNLIENIFKQYGLPVELKYLAVIESSLKKSATSYVGAAGPWQFMPETARNFGLQVNGNNDERRDYYKSTHAAARMLLNLYKELNDWLLVIAAYNGGPQRVFRAINKTGSKDFWKLQYYLPLESRNHVKKFIATHYVMESNLLAFNNENIHETRRYIPTDEFGLIDSLTVSGKYNAEVIAKHLSMKMKEFEIYNPAFNKELMQKGIYQLILPDDKMKIFLSKRQNILRECVEMILNGSR